jgi:hypothetical protein
MSLRNTIGSLLITFIALLGAMMPPAAAMAERGVRLVRDDAKQTVEVFVDGQPFTAYVYTSTMKKPVLFPLRSANGTFVTRGFPLEPRPGERVDHPHHIGLWFNYGDVNGVDFWNNSDAIKADDRPKMGTIVHKAITAVKNGPDAGELDVDMDWVLNDGTVVLHEHTRFVFRGAAGWRSVDRITRLEALGTKVSFTDNKEGVLGLRVTRALELPSKTPESFTDAAGRVTTVKTLDNTGVTGNYLTSEGTTGDAVWGTRGRWCMLSGQVGNEPIAVVILDHPSNPGFPTYWHARGYGLFAANPLGQKALSGGKDTLNFALDANQSTTFRHRVLILSEPASKDRAEGAYREFAAAAK